MDNMFVQFLAGLLAFLLLLVGIANLDEYGNKMACHKYQVATERPTKYVKWDRCYVQTPKGWRELKTQRGSDD